MKRATVSPETAALRFATKGPTPPMGVIYQVVEAGYDRDLLQKALTNGLEVYRELVDAKGKLLEQVTLGEPVTVRLSVRSLTSEAVATWP